MSPDEEDERPDEALLCLARRNDDGMTGEAKLSQVDTYTSRFPEVL